MASVGAIELRDLSVSYGQRPALQRVSGQFGPGSMTAILGPNGAGKSTLLKAIMGDVKPQSGTVDRGGLAARDLAYLPQAASVDRRFPITVGDVVMLGVWKSVGALGSTRVDTTVQVADALRAVGLAGLGDRQIGALSVGQFQRVLFARLLLQNAAIMLLDEPFAAVDEQTAEDLMDVVQSWHAAGRTIIAVLHDIARAKRVFPSALLLARQTVAWGRTEDVLSPGNIARARWQVGGSAFVPAEPFAQAL